MFRLWAKEFKNGRMLRDIVICNENPDMTRTKKVFTAIDEICYSFDLSKPIWLDTTVKEFQARAKTRFTQDHFIDSIPFDFLEIEIIEED